MSADDGIYILKSKDGYRIVHAQCIDNLYWWDKELEDNSPFKMERRDKLNPKELISFFGDSLVFQTNEEVIDAAQVMYNKVIEDVGFCEYGISYITGWEDKEFPK